MYSALLIAPDGDWTVDYHCETVEDVYETVADQGSRWYFYPFFAVIHDNVLTSKTNRIVAAPEPFEDYAGKTIKTLTEDIAAMSEQEKQWLLS